MSDSNEKLRLKVLPREWQKTARRKWQESMRGIISVVTGGGKTLFAELCIIDFLHRFPEGQINIVVPTASLLDQWVVSLQEDSGVSSDNIACYSGEEFAKKPATINVLVINTARTIAKKLSMLKTSMLIVDECHRAGSPVNAMALEGDYSATLGLTATPERQYDDGLTRYIRPVLGDVIYSYDYTAAHKEGVISDFDLVNVKIDLLEEEQKEYDSFTKRIARKIHQAKNNPGIEEEIKHLLQRRAAVSATAQMRIPVSAKLMDSHRGQKTIVFHERVDSADIVAKVLKSRNHSVTSYHSGISPVIRRDNLKLFRRSIFDILVCCRALDEGINVPETEIAIIASSTASIRQRIQRLGRVLRPAPGKENALVYTLYATKLEEQRLQDESKRLESIADTSWHYARMKPDG